MSKPRGWNRRILRIDDINGIARVCPRLAKKLARECSANVAQVRAGIIDDYVAILGEANADNQMPAAARAFAFETIVGNGSCDWDAGFDPIFKFGNIGETADI